MSGTVAFDIKDALVAKLLADATLSAMSNPSCDVSYGFSGRPDEYPRLGIQVGELLWEYERATAVGKSARDEEFCIPIVIHSHNPGDTQQDANGRVKAVMQAIELIVRDYRWSGIVGPYSSGIVPQHLAEGTDAEGRGAIMLLRLYITARI